MKYPLLIPFAYLLLSSCVNLNKSILSDSTPPNLPHYYQTYYVSPNTDIPQELSNSIASAISVKMNAMGYDHDDKTPDLQIFYTIYDDDFTTLVPGTEDEKIIGKSVQLRPVRFKEGAIYISLYDKENDQIVWRGFSDGYTANPRMVKAKAFEMMDRYGLPAATERMITAR